MGRNWVKEGNKVETLGTNTSFFFDCLIKEILGTLRSSSKNKLMFRKAELKGVIKYSEDMYINHTRSTLCL